MKKLLPILASTLVLASCTIHNTLQAPRPQVPRLTFKRQSSPSPVSLVEKKNLEATLAILAGKVPLADGGFIKERGTVQSRKQTREFLSSQLEGMGYQVERHTYRRDGENVFARLMAAEPTQEYILIGAHMDSVHNAGADDNATGSAVVLEAARVLRQLEGRKVNFIFAWFDEEELGLIGSRAMAKDFRKQGLRITSVHTADMVGWDSDRDSTVEIEQPDGILWDYYRTANERHQLKLPLSRTSSGDTDHVAFRREGFTSVGLCEEWVGDDTTPHYHRKSDAYDTVNFDFMANVTRLLVAATGDLSLKVPAPTIQEFIPHSKFPGRKRHFHPDHG